MVKNKLSAWEQIKKDFPEVTVTKLSDWEKQQIVNSKPSASFSCDEYCYTVYSDGTYKRSNIPLTMNLKFNS